MDISALESRLAQNRARLKELAGEIDGEPAKGLKGVAARTAAETTAMDELQKQIAT